MEVIWTTVIKMNASLSFLFPCTPFINIFLFFVKLFFLNWNTMPHLLTVAGEASRRSYTSNKMLIVSVNFIVSPDFFKKLKFFDNFKNYYCWLNTIFCYHPTLCSYFLSKVRLLVHQITPNLNQFLVFLCTLFFIF